MPNRGEISLFSDMIEKRANITKSGLWETLVDYCEETQMEHVVAASLLTKALKEQLKLEVQELNLLKGNSKRGAKLPL